MGNAHKYNYCSVMHLRRLLFAALTIVAFTVFIYLFCVDNFAENVVQKSADMRRVNKDIKHNAEVFRTSELDRRKPHILMWTTVYGSKYYHIETDCPFVNRCTVSYDKRTVRDADAFLFASRYIDLENMPSEKFRKPTALNVYLVSEAYENALHRHRLAEAPGNQYSVFIRIFSPLQSR